jgi:lysophospholipid acyltransferase 5
VFQLGYLVVGYFALNKDTYDISWTMPHCVMTLRLIGLAMDVHDGQKNPVNLVRN